MAIIEAKPHSIHGTRLAFLRRGQNNEDVNRKEREFHLTEETLPDMKLLAEITGREDWRSALQDCLDTGQYVQAALAGGAKVVITFPGDKISILDKNGEIVTDSRPKIPSSVQPNKTEKAFEYAKRIFGNAPFLDRIIGLNKSHKQASS